MKRFALVFGLLLAKLTTSQGIAQELIMPPDDLGAAYASVSGSAESDDVASRLRTLETEIQQLKQQSAAWPTSSTGSSDAYAFPELAADEPPTKPPEPTYPNFKVTGFFQLDWGFYDQDEVNIETLGDIEDGLGFRRARLAAAGDIAKNTSYMMEFDFAEAAPRFSDVWMQFSETPLGNVRIGRFRQPFGMAELTSVRELPFFERPTMFTMAPFRQSGAMLFNTALHERMTWALSGYRFLTDNFGNVYGDDGGYGTAMRFTALPIDCGDDGLVHMGFDYSFDDPARNLVQFASTNEFFVGQNPNLALAGLSVLPIVNVPPFVNTGPVPTEHVNLFNVEAAASLGRTIMQSEVRWALLEDLNGTSNMFPAAYLEVRYMLTGEVIPYSRTGGVFMRPKPPRPTNLWCGDWGAWELASRVSYIDLNGEDLPGPGRRLTNTTLGLNWYVSERAKLQFDWIHSDLNDPSLGSSDAETFATRAQMDF